MRLAFLFVLGLGWLGSCATAPPPAEALYDWHYQMRPENQAWLQQVRSQKQQVPEAAAQRHRQECATYWEEHQIMNGYCVSNRGKQFLQPHPEQALRFAAPVFQE